MANPWEPLVIGDSAAQGFANRPPMFLSVDLRGRVSCFGFVPPLPVGCHPTHAEELNVQAPPVHLNDLFADCMTETRTHLTLEECLLRPWIREL